MSKKRNSIWFKKIRGSYIPNSWQGWLLYVPFILFLVSVLITAMQMPRSASDTLYYVFPLYVSAAVVMTWIAKNKS